MTPRERREKRAEWDKHYGPLRAQYVAALRSRGLTMILISSHDMHRVPELGMAANLILHGKRRQGDDPFELDVINANLAFCESVSKKLATLCLHKHHPGYLKPHTECSDPLCQVREVLES